MSGGIKDATWHSLQSKESYLKPSSSGMELDALAGWEGLGGTGGLDGVVWVI